MAFWMVTGKLGSGKSLVAVSKIQQYLNDGRMVASNLDLWPEHMVNPWAKECQIFRLPDKPSARDLLNLPAPYNGDYDEDSSGLLVLDECATWFNSRNYRDKGRAEVIDVFLHIRKMGWDVILLVQNISMIDSQAREGLSEMVVHCRRTDRLKIPVLTQFFSLAGVNLTFPKMHIGVVKYGTNDSSPTVDRWIYSGEGLYRAYDTRQAFGTNDCAYHTVLSPWYTYGRYTTKREHYVKEIKIRGTRLIQSLSARAVFLLGLVLGVLGLHLYGGDEAKIIQSVEAAEVEVVEPEPVIHELDGVSISGSVYSSGGGSYYIFNRNDETFHPESLGYSVHWITRDMARLKRGDSQYDITTFPFHPKG